jgi:hypothetical protein
MWRPRCPQAHCHPRMSTYPHPLLTPNQHDNSGVASGWFLEKVIVTSMSLQKDFFFLNGRWLDKGEDDGKIEREIAASEKDGVASLPIIRYKVAVTTGMK